MDDAQIQWKSSEPEDRTAQAVGVILEAVNEIGEHYEAATHWPGWNDDAASAVLLASRLLRMAVPEAVSEHANIE